MKQENLDEADFMETKFASLPRKISCKARWNTPQGHKYNPLGAQGRESIHPELDENLGPRPEEADGRRESSWVPRRWLRPPLAVMASLRGCAMVEFGSHPNIRRDMYIHDGDINLLFILVVSTLVYFNACFLSYM